jgi:Holliday junction DNA helicase RuvA
MVSSLISSIRGTLEDIGPDWADVLVGGLTFRINIPASAVEQLGHIGDPVRLLTSLQVREDSLTLFGFPTEEARLAFETLLGVNGVGPRVALSVLSRFTPDSLAAAVESGDTGAFSGVPGVGKKTASRIVLELKGKLSRDWAISSVTGGDGDAIEALAALGYTVSEAREVLSSLPSGNSMSVEEKVRLALQRMGGG